MQETVVLLLAVVFITAAIAKLKGKEAFSVVLQRLLPRSIAKLLTVLVPLGEFVLGAWLLSGQQSHNAALATCAVLVVFSFVLIIMWMRGIEGCACFGEASARPGVGLVRNAILILLTAWLVIAPTWAPIWNSKWTDVAGQITVVVGAICLWTVSVALSHDSERNNLMVVFGWR